MGWYGPSEPPPISQPEIRRDGFKSSVGFWVGANERHYVEFSFDKFWGPVAIRVDGQARVSQVQLMSFSLENVWDIPVGFQELHYVRITKTRKVAFAGFRDQLVNVYVDNVLVAQYNA
jgi:hypothetical protein